MSGGRPLKRPIKRPSAVLFFILSCCGYALPIASSSTASAEQFDASQVEMIPQDEVVVQNEGGIDNLPITYSLRIYKEPDRIKLKGRMSSEEDYKTLIGLVKANFPSVDLSDRIKVKESAPDADVKIGGLSFALKLLGYLETGRALVDNNGLDLQGAASTAVVLTEVKKIIENNKPTGVPLKNIRIAPPSKAWSASLTRDGTLKFSGMLPHKDGRKAIMEEAKTLFPAFTIDENCSVSDSVPSSWAPAALQSLRLLAILSQGSVELTEDTIHLKGIAPTETALKTIDLIAEGFPSGFSLKSEVTAPAAHPGVAAVPRDSSVIMQR